MRDRSGFTRFRSVVPCHLSEAVLSLRWISASRPLMEMLIPETRRRLIRDYSDDIESLQSLVGRDLSHWPA